MRALQLAFVLAVACGLFVLLSLPAGAIELRYDAGTADDYTFQLTDGYLVRFTAPEFVEPFVTGVSFFGARFGEANGAKPQTGYIAILDAEYNKLVSREFNYSDVSKIPSWNHFSIDPVVVRDTKYGAVDYVEKPFIFWVYFLMPSNADAGVMIGKDMDPANLRSRAGNHAAGFKTVSDGKYNWMIRCDVSDGPSTNAEFTSDNLKGEKFIVKDSGVSAGFLSLYKYGATVSYETAAPITIDKLYIYGKLAGDWFSASREFTVYLLDSDLRIQLSHNFPYRGFTSQPAWISMDLPDIKVNGKFHLVVEPYCRNLVQLELGYDGASNKSSSYTIMGQPTKWVFDTVDQTKMNWMMRLEIK
jgi:hypothetical protein